MNVYFELFSDICFFSVKPSGPRPVVGESLMPFMNTLEYVCDFDSVSVLAAFINLLAASQWPVEYYISSTCRFTGHEGDLSSFDEACKYARWDLTRILGMLSRYLIGWVSDTHSQGCTDLHSLITCLDHGDFVAQYAVTQRCNTRGSVCSYGQ